MMHETRAFNLLDEADPDGLARKLTDQTWTLCTAFRLSSAAGAILLLNDSFSEDSAQEFAVFRDGKQIESLTVSWMNHHDLLSTLVALQTKPAPTLPGTPLGFVPRAHPTGFCRHCA